MLSVQPLSDVRITNVDSTPGYPIQGHKAMWELFEKGRTAFMNAVFDVGQIQLISGLFQQSVNETQLKAAIFV